MDLHFGIHSRPEQSLLVVDPDQHRKHGDVLLGLGLRLDLEHGAVERVLGVCIDRDRGQLARLQLPDVGFIHQSPNLHLVEIRHLHQRGTAAHVRRG